MATMDASNRANNWAAQRKQAIDKAKQTREDRKVNLAMAGERLVGANEMGSNPLNRITSSENQYRNFQQRQDFPLNSKKPATMKYGMSLLDQAPSEEELLQARSSLRLLKSKMKESNGFPTMPKNPDRNAPGKGKGYFEEETHEYLQHAPGDRRAGHDNNLNGVYQNDNNNYRKVFKPGFQENQYQKQSTNIYDMDDDQGYAQKNKAFGRNNTLNNQDNYSSSYADPQSTRQRGNAGRPPVSTNKYEPNRDDDYSGFGNTNIPSRIPKNTLNSTKGKMGATGGSNYEDNFAAPNRQRYGADYESPSNRGFTNNTPSYDSKPQNNFGSSMQKNYQNEPNSAKYYQNEPNSAKNYQNEPNSAKLNSANKGWSSKISNLYDDKEPEDTKTFSKPSFKKYVPPPPVQEQPAYKEPEDVKVGSGNNAMPDEYDNEGPQEECPMGCGRKFNPSALEKHAKICKKIFQTKRKAFDSAAQRETDAQAEVGNESKYGYGKKTQKKPAASAAKKGGAAAANNKNKWKQESEAFRANLRAARGGTLSKEEQDNLTAANEAHLVQCPNCSRKFNEHAANRHIPFCASKSKVDNIKKATKGRKM